VNLHRHEPFATLERQREADRLGMALFLASETMLFGAVILGLLALRSFDPAGFAQTSARLSLPTGAANTALLLTSSLLVALAVAAQARDEVRRTALCLLLAILLGAAFLAVKALEYRSEYAEGLMPGFGAPLPRDARLFADAYFIATGLHALHVIVGLGLLGTMAWRLRGDDPPGETTLGNVGLYWHLVDAVWVFLFPILYLSR